MTDTSHDKRIWFVYDGECPLCKSAAVALRIKQEYGELYLLNARNSDDDPVVKKINAMQFDLDEGMVIYDGTTFYHGKDALGFMARYGENRGLFNITNKALFWSEKLAAILYPWMRGVRNRLLKNKGVIRIDNLNIKKSPVFQQVFGESWVAMPPVMHKHYANRPYTNDVGIAQGVMTIKCGWQLLVLSPILRLIGSIPAFNATDVNVTVRFESDIHSQVFKFNRMFKFVGNKTYAFKSYMQQIKGSEVVEVMRFGFSWRMNCVWQGNRVKLRHKGYAIKLFGYFVPLPLGLLIGETNAEEVAVDESTFDMSVQIVHPWWGELYEYKGRFMMLEPEL